MLRALFDNDKPKFYELFSQWITKYFEEGGESLTVFAFLSALRGITDLSPEYIEKVIRHVIVSIPRIQERVLIQEQFEANKVNMVVSSLKNELLSVYDRPKLQSSKNILIQSESALLRLFCTKTKTIQIISVVIMLPMKPARSL